MSDTTTLHVPLEADVRRKFAAKAKQMGFDSAQAYIRVMIKAAVDGRKIDLDVASWGQPSDEAAARLNKAASDAKKGVGLSKSFDSVEDFMKDL